MDCPQCKSDNSIVLDSRPHPQYVRRRRKCRTCCHRWSTVETALDIAKLLKTITKLEKTNSELKKLKKKKDNLFKEGIQQCLLK